MKTRFAPSPTGELHLGNLRTALFNYLMAKQANGCFVLRIEDTDLERSTAEFILTLQEDLHWLGLEWDLGPDKEDALGPYQQSKRSTIYNGYYQKLIEQGVAYPCFCTETELAQRRLKQRQEGKPPRYNGACYHLSKEEVASKQQLGLQANLRLRIPSGQTFRFQDLLKGLQIFKSEVFSDFIIRRSDGSPSFLFCNAVDDALMGVTHVIRGEDHLSNTPKQSLIFHYLNLSAPHYLHLPLITQAGNTPLAKRSGSISLKKLRAKGYLPSAIHNYLARLGHTYITPESDQFMHLAQLTTYFSSKNLHKSSAQFDETQLRFWQKQAVQALTLAEFWEWIGADTIALIPQGMRDRFSKLFQPMILFTEEAKVWAQCLFKDSVLIDESIYSELTQEITSETNHLLWEDILKQISSCPIQTEALIAVLKQQLNTYSVALRKFGWKSIRLALTGQRSGPDLADIITILGFERSVHRLKAMAQQVSTLC